MGKRLKVGQKRAIFTQNICVLVLHMIGRGYVVYFDQVKRSQAEADANAKSGSGIKNSLHLLGLAGDLLLFKDGDYLTDSEAYREFGEYWKTLHPLNRWGGDFKRRKDGNHFSISHGGRA